MYQSNLTFIHLPNEILFLILKKLNNIDVLYSLFDADNQRLYMILQTKTFCERLDFTLTTPFDEILSITDSILNRFCIDILPKIDHNIKSLIIESRSMERILLAANYPNLTELKLFNFTDNISLCHFTDTSPFRHIFQEQITDLILIYSEELDMTRERLYRNGVHEHIFKFVPNLQHLSISGLPSLLVLRDSPLTACSSSMLSKLCVFVNDFSECLALLDSRLKQLTTFIVIIDHSGYESSVVYNRDNLPNLKCFSLTCHYITYGYDTHILRLLRRMPNLEELTLDITIEYRTTFVDGTQIKNQILVHMPRLQKFNFHICTKTRSNNLVHGLSSDDIKQSFIKMEYQHVDCILDHIFNNAICHVFSLPFTFDYLDSVGNIFPPIDFSHVTNLRVYDDVPFQHEFFVRIARSFPLLKQLGVTNSKSQSQTSNKLNSDRNDLFVVAEFPRLVSLSLDFAHIDYVEQFLNETKTHLYYLMELIVEYTHLTIVTENFTRDTTRFNCCNVKKIFIEETLVHSKDFYDYFPLLESCLFNNLLR